MESLPRTLYGVPVHEGVSSPSNRDDPVHCLREGEVKEPELDEAALSVEPSSASITVRCSFYIIFHQSYQQPVLFFNASEEGGTHLTDFHSLRESLETVVNCNLRLQLDAH